MKRPPSQSPPWKGGEGTEKSPPRKGGEGRTAERLERLREKMEERGLDAVLITKMENVRYLSGFTGSNAVAVVSGRESVLVTDGRYRRQAAEQSPSWRIDVYAEKLAPAVAAHIGSSRRVGFESSAAFGFYRRMTDALPDAELSPQKEMVESMRAIKEEWELELIRRALACSAQAFSIVVPMVEPGVSEKDIAAELDYRMNKAGADGPAFDTVVASGPNSALPHAEVTERTIEDGDPVVIDFGAVKDGYCSDISRTLVAGEAGRRALEILEVVRSALATSFKALLPGIEACEVDAAARRMMDERGGYGKYFSHGLGHGVGLEVHEKPSLSSFSEDILRPGMVFTIEPGIYIEGWGGVRIEDMVLMGEEGRLVISSGVGNPPSG